MNLKNQINKLKSFEKIHQIVDINRNISLIEIQRLNYKITLLYENFSIGKMLLQKLAQKSNIKNFLLDNFASKNIFKNKLKKYEKKLFIYVTENEKYLDGFYDRVELNILKNLNPLDQIVTIGEKAKQFAIKNQIKIYKNIPKPEITEIFSLSEKLGLIIKEDLVNKNFSKIIFGINSNKVNSSQAIIFPINSFEFNYAKNSELEEKIHSNINQFAFHPSIEEFVENQSILYLQQAIELLLLESTFIIFKNKLINENQMLKKMEEKIKLLNREIIKYKREMEIQEIILITAANKKGNSI
ncbi:MSC_0622 family F1-like ATPase gamma subunit [Candidatus Mycoplasma pogonae]